jgi:type I restriction enzyme S subunit
MKQTATSTWRETTLSELVDFHDHKRIPLSSAERASRKGEYPYYGASGVIDHVDSYIFDGPYLLISEDGENLNSRKTPIAFRASGKFWVNNHAHIVRGKPKIIDDRFLEYLIAVKDISGLVTGAAQPKLSQANLKIMNLRVPDFDTQTAILNILSAYDDLIENNTRRIKILEDMAQMLYREWFVNFRFPGHGKVRMVESELGPIPAGWMPKRLGDLCHETRRGVDPGEIDPATPYIGLEHLPRKSIALGEWGRAGDVGSTKLRFKRGEILFGKIRPYFHKVGVAPVDGVASSDAIVIVPNDPVYFGPVLCCVSSEDFVRHATQTSQGTKMPRANWDVLTKYPLPLPDAALLEQFNGIIQRTVEMLQNLVFRNRNLRITRDFLLPKLISGEVPVEAAAEAMEQTA